MACHVCHESFRLISLPSFLPCAREMLLRKKKKEYDRPILSEPVVMNSCLKILNVIKMQKFASVY